MRARRLRLEFRVALHRQEPRMARQFDHLDQPSAGTRAGDSHAALRKALAVGIVELKAVPVPLGYNRLAVSAMRQTPLDHRLVKRPEPLRSAAVRPIAL